MGLNTCPLLSFLKHEHVDYEVDADDGGDGQHVDLNAGTVDADDEI